MLAKITSKNQLTLPKTVVDEIGVVEYFDVEVREGQIVLTPVRIQRGDAVRAKLAELRISQADIDSAVEWARTGQTPVAVAAEPAPAYPARRRQSRPSAATRKPAPRA